MVVGDAYPYLVDCYKFVFPPTRHANQNSWREQIISIKYARKFLRSLKAELKLNHNRISAIFPSCLDSHYRFLLVKMHRLNVYFTKLDLIFSHKSFQCVLLLLLCTKQWEAILPSENCIYIAHYQTNLQVHFDTQFSINSLEHFLILQPTLI